MRNIFKYIVCLMFMVLTTGCVYEDLLPEEGGGVRPGDPMTLTFTLGVNAMGTDGQTGTRAIYYGNPVYYEDWIDTQNGFRVLFFLSRREKVGDKFKPGEYSDNDPNVAIDRINPLKDYFLFESTSRWVTQLPYDEEGNLRYQVTVPVYQIGNEETEYREYWARIRELLRTYEFKIAILANHPDNSVNWTVQNSLLSAPDFDDLSTAKKLKTVNEIHHSVADSNYATGGAGRKEGYEMLVDNTNKIDGVGTMGPNIDCVIMRSELYGDALGGTFNDRSTAKKWIRDYWRPDLKYNENTDDDIDYEMLYHDYRHIWYYWNFGGAAPDNGLPYSTKSRINTHIGEWEQRNGALLRGIVTEAAEKNEGILPEISTASNASGKWDASRPVTLHPSGARAVITPGSNGTRFYGISLPTISTPSATTAKDCFFFDIPVKGTMHVRYIANGGTISIKGSGLTTNSTTRSTVNGVEVTDLEIYYGTNVTQTVYVYSSKGTPTVLDIEYVEDEYIYLTDREGILPSSDHPIPMYGIQKYGKLDGYWDEGASFDLTGGGRDEEGNSYEPKQIYLLRSVAKVEVLIPKSLGVPRHVYMRSLNRNARCQPMDAATPTELLWKDHDTECEWRMIQKRGTMYDNGTYTEASYKKKLAWIYGSWLEWGWSFNGFTQYLPSQSEAPFPRLMNPKINRSDFAAFIDVSDYYNDQYYHFLFYMGEGLSDAPSDYRGTGSCMVPHIEIRFDQRYANTSKITPNTTANLGDEDCYRIYFTEGGIASGARDSNGVSTIKKTGYADYEKNPDYLKEHWPIIRNHVYRFTVQDASSDAMGGLIVDAQNRTIDFDFH